MAERSTSPETELPLRHPILLLGGGNGTGSLLAWRLSLEGRIVYIGTRSPKKFNSIHDSVIKRGGTEPKPFIADIKNPAETKEAYENMGLSEGQVVDYFPFAAGGFEPLMSKIARPLVRLKRELEENGFISKESAIAATDIMREFTTAESALAFANETNIEAPIRLAEHLVNNGHLNSSSTIAMLSSSISKYTDPYNIDIYPGPWFYYSVGRSKAESAHRLKALSEKLGATFIDFVAPYIAGTGVGDFFAGLEPVFEALHKIESKDGFEFPTVSTGHVVNVILSEIRKKPYLPRSRDVYIPPKGPAQYTPPEGFDKPTIPYL